MTLPLCLPARLPALPYLPSLCPFPAPIHLCSSSSLSSSSSSRTTPDLLHKYLDSGQTRRDQPTLHPASRIQHQRAYPLANRTSAPALARGLTAAQRTVAPRLASHPHRISVACPPRSRLDNTLRARVSLCVCDSRTTPDLPSTTASPCIALSIASHRACSRHVCARIVIGRIASCCAWRICRVIAHYYRVRWRHRLHTSRPFAKGINNPYTIQILVRATLRSLNHVDPRRDLDLNHTNSSPAPTHHA